MPRALRTSAGTNELGSTGHSWVLNAAVALVVRMAFWKSPSGGRIENDGKLLRRVLGRGWGCPSRLRALAVDHGSWVCGRNGGKGEKALIKEIFRRRDQQALRGLGGKGRAPFMARFRAGCF